MSKPLKILMLNYEYPPIGGGSANATYRLLEQFSMKSDVEVDLVTSSSSSFHIETPWPGITIHRLPIAKTDLYYWTASEILEVAVRTFCYVRRLLRSNRYDLCHCWSGWPSIQVSRLVPVESSIGCQEQK